MNAKTSSLQSPAAFADVKTSSGPTAPRRIARRLPVRRIWPTWVLLSVQFGILVAFVALWEIAAMTGCILAAAEVGLPLLVDGFIASAAALVAVRMKPTALDCCFFAHQSAEAGHALLLQKLGATPLLQLGLRLGEGTGAALAFPLLRAAARLLSEMATFESAGVSEAHPTPQQPPR